MHRKTLWVPVLAAALLAPGVASARGLGKITFPVQCKPAARRHFIRGVLELHSFFYDEARDEFRAASRADHRCAMAYWGEAMSHDWTLWGHQNTGAGREALAKAQALEGALSARDKAFVDAAARLFGKDGDGSDRASRVLAYRDALRRMHERWPGDDEVSTFYALALLSAGDPTRPRLHARMEAAALTREVLRHNPMHPGALHYTIHAFDDPDHAVLALPEAKRYASIAPDAPHARHMPAHIFVELGRFDEAAKACLSAWKSSLRWIEKRHHPRTWADFHSMSWLPPLYAELGQIGRAKKMLSTWGETVKKEGAEMAATYVESALAVAREADRWEELDELLAPADAAVATLDRAKPTEDLPHPRFAAAIARASLAEARALAAARRGHVEQARDLCRRMEAAIAEAAKQSPPLWHDLGGDHGEAWGRTATLRVRAEIAAAAGKTVAAVALLDKAAAIEDGLLQTDGAHPQRSTSHARVGELWLAAGEPKRAKTAFAAALERRPGLSRALLGAARAADALGDRAGAAEYWRRLNRNWKRADADVPGVPEARTHAAAR